MRSPFEMIKSCFVDVKVYGDEPCMSKLIAASHIAVILIGKDKRANRRD